MLIEILKGGFPFEFGGLVDLVRDYFGGGAALEYSPKEYHSLQFRISFADQAHHRKRFKILLERWGT